MTLTSWRSLFMPAAVLLALGAIEGPVAAQGPSPGSAEGQPPPIQAKPGTPEGTPRTDQTVDVVKGTRLLLSNNAGEVIVRTWDRAAVRVQANHSAREQIDIQTLESALRIRGRAQRGASGLVDYRVTVPTWMPVSLTGSYLEADVAGTAAEVTVETVGGNVKVSGGSGAVSLRSVEGTITVEKTTGRVQANAVNEDIRLSNTQGEVTAESINGNVVIDNAQTSSLDISTVNGDVTFNGSVRDNGVYRLTTHGGDIRVGLGGAANVIVFVRTFQGEFSADFPIQLPEGQSSSRGSKRFNFTLGAGSARIELQSFNGDIHLARTTATSETDDRRKRRQMMPMPIRPVPAVPKPPAPPKPPKPPIDIDVEALRDRAMAGLDELKMDLKHDLDMELHLDLDEMHKGLDKLDHQLEHLLDEDALDELRDNVRDSVRDSLRMLEPMLLPPSVPRQPK